MIAYVGDTSVTHRQSFGEIKNLLTTYISERGDAKLRELLVKHDKLLSIYASSMYLPYKLQPDLKIVIDFDEYKRFVEMLVNSNISISDIGMTKYNTAVETGDELLYIKLFLYDTSCVLFRELSLALKYGMDCTLYEIRYKEGDSDRTCTDLVDFVRDKLGEDVCNSVLESNLMYLCPNPRVLSATNFKVYKYCECLKLLSCLGVKAKRINIHY